METEALLNAHQHKLHHLAQFLAAFGASFLPAQPDDGHTSLSWDIAKSSLLSKSANGVHLELEYPGLMLYLVKGEDRMAFDPLGAPLSEVEGWIRETITAAGLSPDKYSLDMGFTPTSPEDVFISLDNNDEKVLMQLTEERNITQKALEEFSNSTEADCSPIRVWPHHFDTGMLVWPEKDDKSKGFGLGYTPADRVSETPYFYAYAWAVKPVDYNDLPELTYGEWHLNNWKGAIIPVNRALDLKVITRFYSEFVAVMKNRI